MAMTRQELSDFIGLPISPEQFSGLQDRRRRAAGPPFRMTIEYPAPPMTDEWLAQTEYEDDMGIMTEPDDCRVLFAVDLESAKAEADRIWRTEPHDGAIGYAIYSADWGCKHAFIVDASH